MWYAYEKIIYVLNIKIKAKYIYYSAKKKYGDILWKIKKIP